MNNNCSAFKSKATEIPRNYKMGSIKRARHFLKTLCIFKYFLYGKKKFPFNLENTSFIWYP